MKLTNLHRDAFVRAVMADVPAFDFHNLIAGEVNQQAARLREQAGIPPSLDLQRLCMSSVALYTGVSGLATISVVVFGLSEPERKAIQDSATVQKLFDGYKKQHKRLSDLESTLRSAIAGCSTLKAAADALPEFAKYLPTDHAALTKNLPALANVAADFMKAGWPKPKSRSAPRQAEPEAIEG